MRINWFLSTWVALIVVTGAYAGELKQGLQLAAELVPGPVKFDVLLPDGYEKASEPLPLLLYLHGAGERARNQLVDTRSWIEDLWGAGELPPMVVVTPRPRTECFYMDYKDGTQQWETFLTGSFLAHLRERYAVVDGRDGTLLCGISMGGAGALQLGLRHLDKFQAFAAIEPAILPAFRPSDVDRNEFFLWTDDFFKERYGDPVSEEYWEAHNPASIVATRAEEIRRSGLSIYLECGDQDHIRLHKSAEFLHRTLWDHGIEHEYHLVHGADHVGRTLKPRTQEALRFLGRVVRGHVPDREVIEWRAEMDKIKKQLEAQRRQ